MEGATQGGGVWRELHREVGYGGSYIGRWSMEGATQGGGVWRAARGGGLEEKDWERNSVCVWGGGGGRKGE